MFDWKFLQEIDIKGSVFIPPQVSVSVYVSVGTRVVGEGGWERVPCGNIWVHHRRVEFRAHEGFKII